MISQTGALTPNLDLLFGQFFSRQLHENERNWTQKGGERSWRQLGSADVYLSREVNTRLFNLL